MNKMVYRSIVIRRRSWTKVALLIQHVYERSLYLIRALVNVGVPTGMIRRFYERSFVSIRALVCIYWNEQKVLRALVRNMTSARGYRLGASELPESFTSARKYGDERSYGPTGLKNPNLFGPL